MRSVVRGCLAVVVLFSGMAWAGHDIDIVGPGENPEKEFAHEGSECPGWSKNTWWRFQKKHAWNIEKTYPEVFRVLRLCEKELKPGGKLECLERMYHYARAKARARDPEYGMGWAVKDSEYLAGRPKEAIELPVELRNGISEERVRLLAKRRGWNVVEYSSRVVSNPPNLSGRRLLIQVPGEKFDRWIQVTLPKDGRPWKGSGETMIDLISVEKTEASKLHFFQYLFENGEFKPIHKTADWNDIKASAHGGAQRCYACHASGMLRIEPVPGSISDKDAPVLQSLNRMMEGYRGKRGNEWFSWDGGFEPSHHGPSPGGSESCGSCHDGKQRGVLGAATDPMLIRSRMQIDFTMPPGDPEAKALREKLALANRLSAKVRKEIAERNPFDHMNAFLLRKLREEKIIDEAELTRALASLETLEKQAERMLSEMAEERPKELAEWLRQKRCED